MSVVYYIMYVCCIKYNMSKTKNNNHHNHHNDIKTMNILTCSPINLCG